MLSALAFQEDMEYVRANCCVHGYHVYHRIWEVAVGEVLPYEREPGNTTGR